MGGQWRGREEGRARALAAAVSEDSGAARLSAALPPGPHFLAFFLLPLTFVADFAATSAFGKPLAFFLTLFSPPR